jgi:hypothetical protein
MKPLTTITIMVRDPMDRETLTPIGKVTFESIGQATIILTRDEIGTIKLEAADIKQDDAFSQIIEEARASLASLHTKLGETHIATNHALTDMFAVHKCLTG